ncbi:MAG TPA: hypothetical protein VF407_01440, partial [Polyangiaceae bacterium]
ITRPGGVPDTQVSDADGHVTFTGIDWSLGNASLVATKDGRAAYAITELNPSNIEKLDDGSFATGVDVALYLFSAAPLGPDTIVLALQNKADPANVVVAGSEITPFSDYGTSDTLTLTSTGTSPFTLITHEYSPQKAPSTREFLGTTVRWARYDEPTTTPPTTNVTLDLADGGTTLTTAITHVHATVPQGQTGALANSGLGAAVVSQESNYSLPLGGMTTVTLGADKASFDLTIETATTAGHTPSTLYYLQAPNGSTSEVRVDGPPVEGSTVSSFLIPLGPPLTVSLSQPIDLSKSDPAARETRLSIFDSTFTTNLLNVDVPAGATSFTVPALPPSLATALNGSAGVLDSFADIDAKNAYRVVAQSRSFKITP